MTTQNVPLLDSYASPDAWYILSGTGRGVDQSGNGHDLSAAGSVRDCAGCKTGVLATRGGSARLVGDGADFRNGDALSVLAHVNLADSSGDRWFAACEKSGANGKTWWKFGIGSDGRLLYAHDHASGNTTIGLAIPTILLSGLFAAVVGVRQDDGQTIDWYVNGVYVGQVVASTTPAGGSASDLIVLNDAYNSGAHALQVVGLYKRVVSAAEALELSQQLLGN